jgi:hypothetical protein
MSLEIQQKCFRLFLKIYIYVSFFTNTFLDNNIAGIELDSLSASSDLQSSLSVETTQDNNKCFRDSRMEERVVNTDVRYCL